MSLFCRNKTQSWTSWGSWRPRRCKRTRLQPSLPCQPPMMSWTVMTCMSGRGLGFVCLNSGYFIAHSTTSLRYKKLQQQLEFLEVQEEYIKDEQRNLKKEYLHAQEEVKRIQSVPLVIGQFLEAVDQNTGIVGSTTGSNYYVRILSTIDRELLKPSASVALHKHSNALVDVLPPEADSSISMLGADEKPDVSYSDIGK